MDPEAVSRLEAFCRELGLDPGLARRIIAEARCQAGAASSAESPEDADSVRRERDRLLAIVAEIMGILGSTSRDKIAHDLRNVLNELILLQEVSGRPPGKSGG